MTNFRIQFDYPWLLLLVIPAAAIALWPYLRLEKKYRRTRNRIISLALHLTIMVLSIGILTGAVFAYDKPNIENEMLILVDASYSNREAKKEKEDFVKSVLTHNENLYKIGIITFSGEAHLTAPMSYDTDALFRNFENAAPHSTENSTNISSALIFARQQLRYPQAAKIVLLCDGIETDNSAMTMVMSLVAEGISVDTVFFDNDYGDEVQIVAIEQLNYTANVGEEVEIGVTLQSSYAGEAFLTLYDNDSPNDRVVVPIIEGTHTVKIPHTFEKAGAHAIRVVLETIDGDEINQNNYFYTYMHLAVFDKILIIDEIDGENELFNLLNGRYTTPVTRMNINNVPVSLHELSKYDQIILMNMSNADLQKRPGLDGVLYKYVHDHGGGVLTVGGKNSEGEPNAYRRDDMNPLEVPTTYQSMLPVICVDYYPPLALVLVMDRSGSMAFGTPDGRVRMDVAKEGAKSTLSALSDRDFIGLVSFANSATVELPLTPVPKRSTITRAIDNMIQPLGGTTFAEAISLAYSELQAFPNVETKHIMIISDGVPTDKAEATDEGPGYEHYIQNCVAKDITISVVAIVGDDVDRAAMEKVVNKIASDGKGYAYIVESVLGLSDAMKADLYTDIIREVKEEIFFPRIGDHTVVVSGVTGEIPPLYGYHGVKLREEAVAPLMGDYTPVYAQWNLGKGKVGSFMSDLNGHWSSDFIVQSTGIQIIENIVRALMPTQPIQIYDVIPEFTRDNYTTNLLVNNPVENPFKDGEYVDVEYGRLATFEGDVLDTLQDVRTADVNYSTGMPRCALVFDEPGIYKITITKRTSGGTFISDSVSYIAFSYSKEYVAFTDSEAAITFLANLAATGDGELIATDQAELVFRNVKKTISLTYNPRIPLIVIVIVLFLIDMAIRKFKFKWPWEIIRDRKLKKALGQ